MRARPFILIPAHNRRTLTVACLATLRANGDLAECGVIVVDDGSGDGTGDAVRAEFPEAVVLRGDGNLFWTGAIALAMREAAGRDAGTLFWLNDDCRPRPGALRSLRECLEKNPNSIAGPRCVDAATGTVVPTGFIGRKPLSAAENERREVEGLSGFCVGIGAGVVAKLGEPDAANFPHYAGDTAYTLRARRAGCPVVLVGDAIVELVDFGGGPATIEARIRSDETLAQNWRRIFAAKNSPYRLRTMRALLVLKYGAAGGWLLAGARTLGWAARLLRARWRR